MYVEYNANPQKRKTSDCVIRAICTALNQDYVMTLHDLVDTQISTGYCFNDPKCYTKYLAAKGFVKQKQPKNPDGTKIRGSDFATKFKDGVAIAHIGTHHIVCIKNGAIVDTWNCSNGKIGNYWIKKEE